MPASTERETSSPGPAIVVGVGPGLGWSLCRAFARAGHRVIAAARRQDEVAQLVAAEKNPQIAARLEAHGCDATDRAAVDALVAAAGTPAIIVHNAGAFLRAPVLDLDPAELERAWRTTVIGALHLAQAAGRKMVAAGTGTMFFTGATASLRGGANFAALAVPKFGLRALAQSLARELHPRGVHVCHVVVDGLILSERTRGFMKPGEDTALAPDAIADTYLSISRQHRSAWTQELDLRPWVETF